MGCTKRQVLTALILSIMLTMVSSNTSNCAPAVKVPPKSSHSSPVNPAPVYPNPKETCPRDTLKLGACANLLNDLVTIVVGTPPSSPKCCPLISGIADLEAAVCLCTAIKANVLGIVDVKLDVALTLILNYCGKTIPPGYQCA